MYTRYSVAGSLDFQLNLTLLWPSSSWICHTSPDFSAGCSGSIFTTLPMAPGTGMVSSVGSMVGSAVGSVVGSTVGSVVGSTVGSAVGSTVGSVVGSTDSTAIGLASDMVLISGT